MKSYHIRKVDEKFKDATGKLKNASGASFQLSDIKIVKIGLVDYVALGDELIPAEEFFKIERREK